MRCRSSFSCCSCTTMNPKKNKTKSVTISWKINQLLSISTLKRNYCNTSETSENLWEILGHPCWWNIFKSEESKRMMIKMLMKKGSFKLKQIIICMIFSLNPQKNCVLLVVTSLEFFNQLKLLLFSF